MPVSRCTLAHAAALDKTLWTFAQNSFVPNVIYQGNAPDDCRDVLISLKNEASANYARFGRVVELILNDDADKISGRGRFRFYREQGVEPETHRVT